jgi:hypothetical protein
VFSLSSSCVFNTQCFLCLWIVHSWLPLRLSLTFIYYVYICKYMNRKVVVQPAYSPHIFGCPTSWVFFVFSEFRWWDGIVDIDESDDHHCLNFLLIT